MQCLDTTLEGALGMMLNLIRNPTAISPLSLFLSKYLEHKETGVLLLNIHLICKILHLHNPPPQKYSTVMGCY